MKAQALARSGLEFALHKIEIEVDANPTTWRQAFTSNLESSPITLGPGTFTWVIKDPTNNMSDNPLDPFTVIATGRTNSTAYKLSIEMKTGPANTPLNCLKSAIISELMNFQSCTLNSAQKIQANDKTWATGSSQINADVNAVTGIKGVGYNGANRTGVTPYDMPGSSVYDYYIKQGTSIDYASIPFSTLQNLVISPANNPFGTTNTEGIYVINCNSNDLIITKCRIVGTLVIQNARTVYISDEVTWEPAYPNYPALLTNGMLHFQQNNRRLNESDANANFNPIGTPWKGQAEIDKGDDYPNVIAGLIYVDDNIWVAADADVTLEGVLVSTHAFEMDDHSSLTILYRDTYFNNPPPGFCQPIGGPPRPIPGSLQRVIN